MNELLYELYDKLYTPLAMTKQRMEIYNCHHKLIEVQDKPECKLLLTIMDRKDEIADELAFWPLRRAKSALSTELSWHCSASSTR